MYIGNAKENTPWGVAKINLLIAVFENLKYY